MDKIVVGPGNGIKTGMSLVVNRYDGKNCNIRRQCMVEPEYQVGTRIRFDVGMKNKLAGVYLRICAATAYDGSRRFQHLGKRIFYYLLNSQAGNLPLPAMIVKPVEGDVEKMTFDGI